MKPRTRVRGFYLTTVAKHGKVLQKKNMKKHLLTLALPVASFIFASCEETKTAEPTPEAPEQGMEVPEVQEKPEPTAPEPVVLLTADQVRSIVHDEVAKAIGSMRLEMASLGLPMVTTTFDSNDVVQHVDISPENSRFYWQEVARVESELSADTVRGKAVLDGTRRISWHGLDYSIVVQPSRYSHERNCKVSTFIVQVFEVDKPLETLTLSIDETVDEEGAKLLYVGRMYYRLFEDGKPASAIADYGTCAARLSEFIQTVPILLKSGKLVEV